MDPTFSVFARAFRIEAPFMNEWLEYHVGIGFSTFYIVVAGRGEDTDEDHEFLLQRIAPEFIPRVRLFKAPDCIRVPEVSEQLNLRSIWDEDERVLFIDIDEFLVLQRHGTIQEFWEQMPGRNDGFSFEWVNYPSDDWGYDGLKSHMRSKSPLVGVNRKGMARIGSLEKIGNHRHSYIPGAFCRKVEISDAFLCHLCNRGLADTICRILCGSFKSNDTDIALMKELIRGAAPPANLPRRLILMHAQLLMAAQSNHRVALAKHLPELRYGCDDDALSELIGRALGAGTNKDEIELTRCAMNITKKYRVKFDISPREIHDLGGFVTICNRLRVVERNAIGDGEGEHVCYTLAAVPEDGGKGLLRQWRPWSRWLRRRM